MGAITARPLWRAIAVTFLSALSMTSTAGAADIYIGVGPGFPGFPSPTGGPGTLVVASDSTASGVLIGDAFPSEQLTGYGGLGFDSFGNLWATVGEDDSELAGSEAGTLSSTLVRINPANGSVAETVGLVRDANDQSVGITDLAVQPGTNVIYGVNSTTFFGPQPCNVCIFTIDENTGVATSLGIPSQGSSEVFLDTLAFAPDGTLYGTGTLRNDPASIFRLFTINPVSGDFIGTPEIIVRDPQDPNGSDSTPNPFGLGVRSDGTIFGTLCCTNEIVYRDNGSGLWRILGATGAINADSLYADLAFAPEAIPTPVPASVWLFGSGLAALLGLRRRRA
jgi:hypothetical protein